MFYCQPEARQRRHRKVVDRCVTILSAFFEYRKKNEERITKTEALNGLLDRVYGYDEIKQ